MLAPEEFDVVESLESKVKKLERERAGAAEPVSFRVTFVRIDAAGAVWTDHRGKVARVDPRRIGIEDWTRPDTTSVRREEVDPPSAAPMIEGRSLVEDIDPLTELQALRRKIARDFPSI